MAPQLCRVGTLAVLISIHATNAFALTATPWRTGWQTFIDIIQSDVVMVLTVIGCLLAAAVWVNGGDNLNKGLKFLLGLLMGLSIINAATWVASKFGLVSTGMLIP